MSVDTLIILLIFYILQRGNYMGKFHHALIIKLANEKIFFGPGVVTLLNLTKELGSLNASAQKMNLSYSKVHITFL